MKLPNPNYFRDPLPENVRKNFNELRKKWRMEQAKTREQIFVEAFQGLSLAETVVKLRNLGIRAEVEDGFVLLHHPFLPTDYERRYPETLLVIRGTRQDH